MQWANDSRSCSGHFRCNGLRFGCLELPAVPAPALVYTWAPHRSVRSSGPGQQGCRGAVSVSPAATLFRGRRGQSPRPCAALPLGQRQRFPTLRAERSSAGRHESTARGHHLMDTLMLPELLLQNTARSPRACSRLRFLRTIGRLPVILHLLFIRTQGGNPIHAIVVRVGKSD